MLIIIFPNWVRFDRVVSNRRHIPFEARFSIKYALICIKYWNGNEKEILEATVYLWTIVLGGCETWSTGKADRRS